MKKINEQTMIEAMRVLNNHVEENTFCQQVFDMLANILRLEMNEVKVGKLNLWDYALRGKESVNRPFLTGIYHENGYKVSTDAHVLCVVKSEYPEYLEGQILAKDGSLIEGKFPKWQSVIPDTDNMQLVKLDLNKFADAVNDDTVIKKMEKGNKIGITIKINNTFYRIELVKRLVTFLNEYGLNEVYYQTGRPLMAVAEDGSKCIITPCAYEGNDERVMDITE